MQRGHPSLGAILADPPLRHASTVGRLPNGDTALDPVHTGVILNTIHDIRISKDAQGTIAAKDGRKRGKQGKESHFLHFGRVFVAVNPFCSVRTESRSPFLPRILYRRRTSRMRPKEMRPSRSDPPHNEKRPQPSKRRLRPISHKKNTSL